ncbi:VpaChn25_0724 family phage protein [Oligella urethralis]|uniref:VpaChn25_0724 family phage protein n=1 Tax=Oligella urethralis TaxID=90245 RepID=UPI00288BEBF6|nr:winged-helix domain-containing protein [Oligella urethralis]
MNKYDIFAEDQRLLILKSLDDAGYDANESILQEVLEQYGHRIGRELIRAHLAWLEQQGLVVNTKVANFFVAKLTSKGLEVAQGLVSVPGVKRPRPIY